MKEQFEIECEMRVSVDILKEQHMRFLVDPYKCWKMVDYTTAKVAKSDLVLEVPKGKSEKKKRDTKKSIIENKCYFKKNNQ